MRLIIVCFTCLTCQGLQGGTAYLTRANRAVGAGVLSLGFALKCRRRKMIWGTELKFKKRVPERLLTD